MRSAAATPTIIFVVVVFMSARKRELPPQKLSRSEEHTSELQSQSNLVCRLLLEKKNVIHRHSRTLEATLPLPISPAVIMHELDRRRLYLAVCRPGTGRTL